jgi:hypothetical protein
MQQRCPNCGSPVAPGQRFCGGCGAQISLACPQCRITVSPGTRFCPNCGATLGGGMPQQPGWGQQPGGMPPQQPGWGQQPGGMPQQPGWGQQQQPGWGQQPAWAPPAPSSQSSSRRPFLVILLIILLIGLGTLTYFKTPIGTMVKDLLSGTGGATTADTTAPVITDARATDISTTKVTIRWTTDDLSSSQVEYGPTAAYGSAMPAQPDTDPSTGNYLGVIDHVVDLTDLQLGAEYHYRVKSINAAGLEGVSPDKTFTTSSAEE